MNASISWNDGYLLGFNPMDQVHQEFVEFVAALQQAADSDLDRVLGVLLQHCQAHFEQEDRWMLESDFPASECHINEHAAVLKSIHEVKQQLVIGNVAVCRQLGNELAAWFPGHADYLDSALAHWMCKRTLGGKPVILRRNIKSTELPIDSV